jgi:bifunctional DNA-binding transcriptional regulator/antitoxin component of YhaV-PrlF toxin-antitoxin module
MKIDTDGKITISPELQEQLGLQPGTEVQLEVRDNTLQIHKTKSPNQDRDIIAAIRGKATSRLTTNDIMQLTRKDP